MQSKKILFLFSKSVCHLAFVGLVSLDLNWSCLWLCAGGRPDCSKVSGCPRLLHYSASLHLVDMLPPPPPVPTEDATDSHSLTSDEGLETHSLKPTGWAMQADKQKMLMHWFFSTTLGRQHVDGLMCVWIICRCSKKTTYITSAQLLTNCLHLLPTSYIVYSFVQNGLKLCSV